MARRYGFKPKLRDIMASNHLALRFHALGTTPEKLEQAQAFLSDAADALPAAPKKRAAPRQLEAPVVAAIADLLSVHPRVLFAVRQNSGAASYEAKSGNYAPVHFYRILTGQPVTITDFWGLLRDGRMLAVEAKAPGWIKPRTDREFKQAAFLSLVNNCGGLGFFATNAEYVDTLLKQ